MTEARVILAALLAMAGAFAALVFIAQGELGSAGGCLIGGVWVGAFVSPGEGEFREMIGRRVGEMTKRS